MQRNNSDIKVLVIGAGGFIGGFITAESLRRGFDTTAGVRSTTNRKFLEEPGLKFLNLDYGDVEAMTSAFAGALPEGEAWDWIVYNLGATKCANFADFNRINYLYLQNVVAALRASGKMPKRFLYMSSLSAIGPGDEKGYTPLSLRDIPNPNTRYGVSKIKAETFLETCSDLNWTIFRPTGVYGPHEKDYMMMVKSIDSGWDFGVGMRRQMLTFIYVKDLAKAIFDALESSATLRKKYLISAPRAYSQSEFRKIVADALGRKFVIPVRLPLWMAYAASVVCEKYGVAKMQPSTLNRDKFKIMKQRNWTCDISAAQADFGFTADYDLRRGIAETVASYLEEKKARKDAKKHGGAEKEVHS